MQILAIYPPHVFPRGSLLLLTANGSSHEQGDHDYLVLPYCLGQNPTAAETTAAQPFFVRLFSSSPLVVIPETFSDGVSAHRALALGALHEALIVYSPSRGVNMHARMAGEAALHGKLKRRIAGGGKGTCSFGGGGGSGSGGGGGGGGGGASRSSSSSESTALSAALSACSVLTVTGDGAVAILGVNRSDASATFEVDSYVKVPSPPAPSPSLPAPLLPYLPASLRFAPLEQVNVCRAASGVLTNQPAMADAFYARRRALEEEQKRRAEEAQRRNGDHTGGRRPTD